jgi:hypothetical protein
MKPTNLYLKPDDLTNMELLIKIFQSEGITLADERGGKRGSKSALVRHLVTEELKRRGVKNP